VVKITSALDVFWPNWSNEINIPKKGSLQEIKDACKEGAYKYQFIQNLVSKGISAKEAKKAYEEHKIKETM